MNPRCPALVLLCFLIGASVMAYAAEPGAVTPATRSPSDGWFFYRDPPPPVAKPKPEPKPPGNGISLGADVPLSAAWIRENLNHYLDRATDEPTVENVQLYMHLQKVAMDKAETFSQVQRVAVALDESIDESVRNPVTGIGKAAKEDERSTLRREALKTVSRKAGVWYFFRSDCTFCLRQSPVLKMLQDRTGIAILPISIDGAPMIDGSYPDFVVDEGHAAQLQVNVTPTLFLSDGKTITPLATGLRALPELERRILSVSHEAGWLTDAEYGEATSGSELMKVDLSKPPPSSDPATLLAYLREMNGLGGTPISPRAIAPSIPGAAQ